MLLLDCRAEREKDQVCSKVTYDRIFNAIKILPPSVKQLVLQLGIPIAYPRMNFAEKALFVFAFTPPARPKDRG